MHHPKGCEYKNEDEDYSPNTLSDENYQALSLKFRQIINFYIWNIQLNIIVRQKFAMLDL